VNLVTVALNFMVLQRLLFTFGLFIFGLCTLIRMVFMSQSLFPSRYKRRQAIALISDHGDPAADIGREEAGGQNVYVRQVGEALARLGWQVDMFTRKSNANDPTIVQHTPHCRTIRLKAGPEEFVSRDEIFQYMPEFLASFRAFQTKEGVIYPLVHSNYWMSAWIGLKLKASQGAQLIHTYHSLGAVKYQSVLTQPEIVSTRLSVEKSALEQSDCVVATSPQEMQHLRSLVSQKGNVEIIPCGTDTSNFKRISRSQARAKLEIPLREQVILYVGRFDPRKGIETLVRAVAKLRSEDSQAPLRLVLVGGSEPGQSDGLGIDDCTFFAGRVGHDQLPLFYTAADVCVIPSHYEPFGLVAIEAMACGTPVVASDVGGLKFTVIPEETGLLVPPQDENGFAAAIDRLLSDSVWTQKVRRKAAIRVQENFSWEGVAIQLSDLYRRSLAQSIAQPEVVQAAAYRKAS
jgi:D-inositol-3-phosphate glycosyltransferase